jgi:argininosuccinate lyase
LKEEIFPGLESLKSCVEMSTFMLKDIQIKKDVLNDKFYQHVFSVEVVNDLVLSGMPFRDAYKKVGLDIESGDFAPDQSTVSHTHEGSIGNLCLPAIKTKFKTAIDSFDFTAIDTAFGELLSPS